MVAPVPFMRLVRIDGAMRAQDRIGPTYHLATFGSFFRKPRIWTMIAAVFFYRFGEGLMPKVANGIDRMISDGLSQSKLFRAPSDTAFGS